MRLVSAALLTLPCGVVYVIGYCSIVMSVQVIIQSTVESFYIIKKNSTCHISFIHTRSPVSIRIRRHRIKGLFHCSNKNFRQHFSYFLNVLTRNTVWIRILQYFSSIGRGKGKAGIQRTVLYIRNTFKRSGICKQYFFGFFSMCNFTCKFPHNSILNCSIKIIRNFRSIICPNSFVSSRYIFERPIHRIIGRSESTLL